MIRLTLVETTMPFNILPRLMTLPMEGHFLPTKLKSFPSLGTGQPDIVQISHRSLSRHLTRQPSRANEDGILPVKSPLRLICEKAWWAEGHRDSRHPEQKQ